jgi:aminoglycoside phosphotransferase family enzyme
VEEVRLNRRLAPEVYLGVVPLTCEDESRLRLDGSGTTVDWLVKMHRLPRERMLDRVIAAGDRPEEELRKVGLRLARFYRDAAPVPTTSAAYRRRLAADIAENRKHLGDAAYGLAPERIAKVCEAQSRFLLAAADRLGRRAEEGRIIEAHGDLRPEHICLSDPPQIIDCLEFKRAFRILDPADELSFLSLECERLGAPGLGPIVFQTYREVTRDSPSAALIAFYKSYRACLRAKLAVWHLRDDGLPDPQKWRARAATYLDLAEAYAAELD